MDRWNQIDYVIVDGVKNPNHAWRNGKLHKVVGIHKGRQRVCVTAVNRDDDVGVRLTLNRLTVK